MAITQTRMLAVIDAARVWEASYEALRTAARMHINELENRARSAGASPEECAALATRLMLILQMNEPDRQSVRALDAEQGHFSAAHCAANIRHARVMRGHRAKRRNAGLIGDGGKL